MVLVVGIAFGALIASLLRREPEPAAPQAAAPTPSEVDGAFVRIVRALPLGVIFVDRNSRVNFANAAAGTIFDFDVTRALGAHIIASIPNVELERRIADALRGEASVAPMILTNAQGQRT